MAPDGSLIGLLDRHGRSITLIALALAIAGLVASFSMPVNLFPQVAFPRVVVDLEAGDRPAAQSALLLTRPIEDAIRTVPGVRELRSSTSRGAAQISVDFGWGRDMIATTLLVDSAISRALPRLPAGTAYTVRRMDPTVFPILSYALTSSAATPTALRDLATLKLVPLLASIPGLARVDVQGGGTAEIEVLADPHRLAAKDLGLADLVKAISASNVVEAVGRLQDHDRLYLVIIDGGITALDALRQIVVRSSDKGVVRLGDIAEIRDGTLPQWTRISADGKPAVLFNVYEQPDGNLLDIAGAVHSRLEGAGLPADVQLVNWYDQSQLVRQSAASVRDAVLIGLVLAGFVLVAFLRNFGAMLVALIVVPASLGITMLLLRAFGLGFNIMTLGGIAAAVGLIIDDVIVMLEHLARRAARPAKLATGQVRRDSGLQIFAAAREFLAPLTGSSLATLIVFLPLAALGGVTGAFSRTLAITMAAALVVSYLLSASLVPILARRWIDFEHWKEPAGGGWLDRGHGRLLARLTARPSLILLVLLPLLALGIVAYRAVPSGFMPAVDEGGFVMDFYTRPGTSLIETDREIRGVEKILDQIPEVAAYSRRTGTGLGGDLGEAHHGDFFVRLKDDHARSTPAVMAAVLARVQAEAPGVEIELAQLMEDLIGDLTAVPQPIEIKLFATDPAVLLSQARSVAALTRGIDGVQEVRDGIVLAGDSIDVDIDPVRASLENVSADEVSQAVRTAIEGVVATQIPIATKMVGVRVRLPEATRLLDRDLAELPIRAPDGHLFPLQRIASLKPVTGESELSRDDLQPMIAVTGRIEGRGIGATVADLRRALAQPGVLQPGVRYELGGLYQQQQAAFIGLAEVFAAALVTEFALLLILYEQLMLALIIIATSLLSVTAVFIALWATGVELNITALMGMTMVIGVSTEMAIFFVSEYRLLARDRPVPQAIREAAANRLRPITMTTLAAILTLLPLALAMDHDASIQQPLAIAIIAGLMLQYPIVLLVLPVLIGTRRTAA